MKNIRLNIITLIILGVFSIKSLAWRIDYSLDLPGNSHPSPDVINYLIFSKELLSQQNEKMHPNNNNIKPTPVVFVGTR